MFPVFIIKASVAGSSGVIAMQTVWCNDGNSLLYVRQKNILTEQTKL